MARLDSFLRLVAEQQASDLHLSAGNVPLIRHDGDLLPLPFRVISEEEARRFILEILTPDEIDALENRRELDFVYSIENLARFRVNVFMQSEGPSAVFRVIPSRIPTLDELHMPPVLKKLATYQNGLVLICGATGSGKSTTLAALVREINVAQRKHVVTIEDPVEYLHEPVNCIITQRQVGIHAKTFASALRSALREAPDVLVVGELRDYDTMSLALSAAETGVLVFATLHTNSAAKAVDRFIDAFPDDVRDQVRGTLSVLLRGVVAQHLAKRATGEGRIAVVEVLLESSAVSNMIRENKVYQLEAYLQGEHEGTGMQSLDACIIHYVKENLITLEDGVKLANDQELVRRALSADASEEG